MVPIRRCMRRAIGGGEPGSWRGLSVFPLNVDIPLLTGPARAPFYRLPAHPPFATPSRATPPNRLDLPRALTYLAPMFCSRCGSEITGKSKFCPSCGLDLMATTPVHAVATGVLQERDVARESLAAEYEIIEELGRGGMAMVYRARDRQLEREVAVKVLPFSLAFDSEFVERFQREARTAAQLEHPNIIPIYRVGRSGRVIYFVMKFLRGGSLSTVLGQRKKLTPPEIRRLLIEARGPPRHAGAPGHLHPR